MKLNDILHEFLAENDGIDDISVVLPEELLRVCNIALESIWQQSSKNGWIYRVDPEDPSLPLQRHIHIAKEKHKSTKNMQASWNIDGTRHDKKSFNDSVGNTNYARQLARDILNIPSNICLESFNSKETSIISDKITFSEDRKEAYIRFSLQAN